MHVYLALLLILCILVYLQKLLQAYVVLSVSFEVLPTSKYPDAVEHLSL
jgi:hypothetical protein